MASATSIVVSGAVTLENVRGFAEAGADLIRVDALTQSVRAMDISFQIQAGVSWSAGILPAHRFQQRP